MIERQMKDRGIVMDERMEKLLGLIFEAKDDMDAVIHVLKTLELLFEYEVSRERRYLIKVICFMVEKIYEKVDSSAFLIDEITR